MSCTACSKSYGFFTKEVGCPNCGFSFCTKCLKKVIEVPKLKNAVSKVCLSCYEKLMKSKPIIVQSVQASTSTSTAVSKASPKNDQPNVSILDLDVPESEQEALPDVDDEIKKRLQVIKQPLVPEEVQSVSDIGKRLANLKGVPFKEHNNIDALNKVDKRTEQEKTNDMMKQFLEENEIDSNAAGAAMNDFDADDDPIKSIERRLAALKGAPTTSEDNKSHSNDENEDEETATNKIVKRYLEAAKLPNSELTPEEKEYVESIKPADDTEELPWCTICNEDATIRCEGCDGDLFCRACFKEIHADDEEYREHKTKKFVAKEEKIENV